MGIWELMRKNRLSLEDGIAMRQLLYSPGGLELHIGMFIPTILSQGTPEQQKKWLSLSNRLKIIGTYAQVGGEGRGAHPCVACQRAVDHHWGAPVQTELGHGTFVRGLETVAAYDKQRQEFVVHSPTLTRQACGREEAGCLRASQLHLF